MDKFLKKTLLSMLLLAVWISFTSVVFAAPNLINYQGVLTDNLGAPVTNASQQMTFRLYDAETAGNLLWEEVRIVDVQNGSYNLLLGSVEPLAPVIFDLDELWMQVMVAGELLSGRQRLASVPYALQAARVSPGAVEPSDLVAACADGEILVQSNGVWICGTSSALNCNPGDFVNCYTGAPVTKGVGPCTTGVRTCDPLGGWGGCADEVIPVTEICDSIDNDCNGLLDDAPGSPLWYPDADNDGFGVTVGATPFCAEPPAGFADNTLDCDDTNAGSSPLLREVCGDGIDNDCDTLIDPPGCLPPGSCPAGALAVIQQLTVTACFAECAADATSPQCISCLTTASGYDNGCITDAMLAALCILTNNCTPDLRNIDYQCVSSFCGAQYMTAFGPFPRDCVPGTTRSCGSDIGACQVGTEVCVDGSWSGFCQGEVGPVAEICGDGIDNDCNNNVDDGCTPPEVRSVYYDTLNVALVIEFDLPIDPGSVFPDAGQFALSGGLVASEASVVDTFVYVTLTNPQHGATYDVTVAGSVTSIAGIGIDTGAFPLPFDVVMEDGSPCDDGDSCTLNDMVQGGICTGEPMDCSPLEDSCNNSLCVAGTCVLEPVPQGFLCDDGDVCTVDESCDGAGSCVGGSALDCDDGDPYTSDSCDPVSGCQYTPVPDGTACDDGDLCTHNDQVFGGVCVGNAYSCDDGRTCTTDSCDGNGSCSNTVVVGSCLIDGACYSHGATNPINACQMCDVTTSQTFWSLRPSGSACGDATYTECTLPDTCDATGNCNPNDDPAGTVCGGTPGDCYLASTCSGSGTCVNNGYKPSGVPCGDPTQDACNNPDSCNGSGTCNANNLPNGTSCDDGNPLTSNDLCFSGTCLGAPLFECGNGVFESLYEMCDDNNTDACGTCSASCQAVQTGGDCGAGVGCVSNTDCASGSCVAMVCQ